MKFGWILLVLLSTNLVAQTIFVPNNSNEYTIPNEKIEILEDSINQFSNEDILLGNPEAIFKKSNDPTPSIENTNSTYWIQLSIDASQHKKNLVFEILDPHFSQVEIYLLEDTLLLHSQRTGYDIAFKYREIQHKNFVFKLPKTNKPIRLFLKLKSKYKNVFLFKIRTTEHFIAYSLVEYYLLGFFYGILFIMAIYHLMVYFTTKEKLYLHYVFYVLSCALVTFAEDGIGFHLIWQNTSLLNHFIHQFNQIIFFFAFILYTMSFLELKRQAPKLNRALEIVIPFYTIFYIALSTMFDLNAKLPIYVLPYFILFILITKLYSKQKTHSKFYFLGYTVILISITVKILHVNGYLPWDNIYIIYSVNIGSVVEILIFSLAQGEKIRSIKRHNEDAQLKIIEQLRENQKLKDQLNKELEAMVALRTSELKEKNEILFLQKESLEEKIEELGETNVLLKEAYTQLSEQAEEIQKMNEILHADKNSLKKNVQDLVEARVLNRNVNYEEFSRIYPNDETCQQFLSNLKWGKGFNCKKCGYDNYCTGKDMYSRRCNRCRYHESATAYTIFQNLKFPLHKAFYLVYMVYSSKNKVNSVELSQLLGLRQATCWAFIKKVGDTVNEMIVKKKDIDSKDWISVILQTNPPEIK